MINEEKKDDGMMKRRVKRWWMIEWGRAEEWPGTQAANFGSTASTVAGPTGWVSRSRYLHSSRKI